MRISVIVGSAALAIACGIWDIAVRPFVPFAALMEPLLASVVILALLQQRQASWIVAVLGALMIDAFQFGSWPWLTIFICLYVLILQLLVTHVLTNRSFYSAFALLAVGRFIGWLVLWLSHESVALWPMPFGLTSRWLGVGIQLGLDAIWVLLWYFFVSYWARRGPARYAQPKWFA
jgi:hypothetical protein